MKLSILALLSLTSTFDSIPIEMLPSEYPKSTTTLGKVPFSSSGYKDGHLRIYHEQLRDDVFVPIYQVLPAFILVEDGERLNKTCTSFHLECRQLLSMGSTVEEVLGDDVLDVTGIAEPSALPTSHKFTQWAIRFLMTFGETHWDFKLASVYCLFHLMRVRHILRCLR